MLSFKEEPLERSSGEPSFFLSFAPLVVGLYAKLRFSRFLGFVVSFEGKISQLMLCLCLNLRNKAVFAKAVLRQLEYI